MPFQMFPDNFLSLSRNERASHQLSNITTTVQESLLVLSMTTAPTQPCEEVSFQFKFRLSSAPLLNLAGSREQLQQVATDQGTNVHRDSLLHSSGGWTSRSRCQQGWFFWGLGEDLLHGSRLSKLLAATPNPWLLFQSLWSVFIFTQAVYYDCVSKRHFRSLNNSYFVFLVYDFMCVCAYIHACACVVGVCGGQRTFGCPFSPSTC